MQKPLMNLNASLKNLARTCRYTVAASGCSYNVASACSEIKKMQILKRFPMFYSFNLSMRRDLKTSLRVPPKMQFLATSRLSLLTPVRAGGLVRNGYGRARGVGAAPRRQRSNDAIWPRNSTILRPVWRSKGRRHRVT